MLPDETIIGGTQRFIMMENFTPGYEMEGFWNDQYLTGPRFDMDYVDKFHERNKHVALANPNLTTPYEEYDLTETIAAGYVMMKLNYGKWLSIIPGVRYEHSDNTYSGTMSSLSNDGTGAKWDTTTYQNYGELLPSIHVKVKPLDWFDMRFSAVKTLSRPDYNMVTPRARIDVTNAALYRGNPDLKHLEAWNYDATFSFFSNKLGLFTIGGFYKHFDNYFSETDRVMGEDEARAAGLPVMVYEVKEDYINFDDSKVYGIEVDMQTNFSYLRAPFNGIVLSANVSRLWSQTFQPLYEKITVYDPGTRTWIVDVEQSYYKYDTTSLPDQTEWIANFTIGYDFKGFSARFSMIYQSSYLRGLGSSGEAGKNIINNRYTDDFLRFDASLSQRIGDHILIMANFANISAESERSYQYIERYWRNENRYGMTFDLGFQYRF
jgi:TonB-dependent receptor